MNLNFTIIIFLLLVLSMVIIGRKSYRVKASDLLGSSIKVVVKTLNEDLTTIDTPDFINSIIPSNMIVPWSGSIPQIPTGWVLCDSKNGTPDLRGLFIQGLNPSLFPNSSITPRELYSTGGFERVTLQVENLPPHNHNYILSGQNGGGSLLSSGGNRFDNNSRIIQTSQSGSTQSHDNMPPFYVLAFIMKTYTPTSTSLNLIPSLKTVIAQQDNSLTTIETSDLISNIIPEGVIMGWADTVEKIPVGWVWCDGQNGTPDLRGRFILGSNLLEDTNTLYTPRSVGVYGGLEKVKLDINTIPRHSHQYIKGGFWGDGNVLSHNWRTFGLNSVEVSSEFTGGDEPHENIPPFMTLTYIIKKSNPVSTDLLTNFNNRVLIKNVDEAISTINIFDLIKSVIPVGIIVPWSGTIQNLPRKWAVCNGKNGTPDLRGRFVLGVNPSNSPNTSRSINSINNNGGSEKVKLSLSEMPSHSHSYQEVQIDPYGGGTFRSHADNSWGVNSANDITSSTGGDQPHENMPPFYVALYIMKIE